MVDRLLRLIGETFNPKKPNTDGVTIDELKHVKGEVVEGGIPQNRREQISPKPQDIVIDSETGKEVEEVQTNTTDIVQSIEPLNELSSTLPGEVAKLAAQNKAFFQGILSLQRLHLDDDLFQDAVETLKQKYYKERETKR